MTQTNTPSVPNVLVPVEVNKPSLALRLAALKQATQAGVLDCQTNLLNFRNAQRNVCWLRAQGWTPEEWWSAQKENGVSIAKIASELDNFLEAVNPGILKGDVGVPEGYKLDYDLETGYVTCTTVEPTE